MASLNKVLLIGNLTRDPELKSIATGRKVCELRLAVSRRYRSAKGEDREETCFVDVHVWDRQGEQCKEHLRKGASVFVEGRLIFDTWDRKDGTRASRHSVLAERIQFLDRWRSAGEGVSGPARESSPVESAAEGSPSSVAGSDSSGEQGGDDEDLPF